MKVAVIGAGGLIGEERIKALHEINKVNNDLSILAYDLDVQKVIKRYERSKMVNAIFYDLNSLFLEKPDWTFICVPHDIAPSLIKQAFEAGSNVLVEKPLGRNLEECESILKYKPNDLKLNIGFNYRFYNGIEQILKDCKDDKFGKLISINMMLGHGNSPDILNTWKLDPIKCGGCLIDPGVHLLDLVMQIANGEVEVEKSKTWQGFWNNGIEEEAHLIISDANDTIFNVQISLNRWRSIFRLEINGTEGYGVVEGRGKSYGPQSYRTGKRWGWQSGKSQSDSEEWVVKNMTNDNSFIKETCAVLGIKHPKELSISTPSNDKEALKVMKLLEQCKGAL